MAQEDEVEAANTQQGTAQGAPQASVAPVGLREDQIQNAMSFLSHPKVRQFTRGLTYQALQQFYHFIRLLSGKAGSL